MNEQTKAKPTIAADFKKVSDIAKQVLEGDYEFYPDTHEDWHLIEGKAVHAVIYGHAWTDGYSLVFPSMSIKDAEKFLYYMGAENEAVVEFAYKRTIVYTNIDEERLERYIKE